MFRYVWDLVKNYVQAEKKEIGSGYDEEIVRFKEYCTKKISYLKRPIRTISKGLLL